MRDIVIEIRKGMISDIFSDVTDARFIVVDWDLKERQDQPVAALQQHGALENLSKPARLQIGDLT